MLYYTILLLLLLIICLLFYSLEKNFDKDFSAIYLITFTVILFLVASFRSEFVGTDTRSYENIFFNITNNYNKTLYIDKFPGYYYYNLILSFLSSEPHFVTIINSLIVLTGISYSVKRLSINKYLSSLLFFTFFFYFNSLNISRQYIALVFMLISFVKFKDNNKLISLIMFLLSISFHPTAFIGIIYFIYDKIEWNIKKYSFLALLALIFPLTLSTIQQLFLKIFPAYNMYFSDSSLISINTLGSGNKILLTLFFVFWVFLGLIICYYNIDKNDKTFRWLLALCLTSVIFDLFFYKIIIIDRMSVYLSVFFVFYLSYIPRYISAFFKERIFVKLFLTIFIFTLSLAPFYFQLSRNNSNVIPYTTIEINKNR
ncbi:EpsG family protein [Vagococcus fluvialis]|uniref:EpsG family protein n=1 Tax=Vagococcus fluvialis TaxID=2738 RepID=UPI0032E50DEA